MGKYLTLSVCYDFHGYIAEPMLVQFGSFKFFHFENLPPRR